MRQGNRRWLAVAAGAVVSCCAVPAAHGQLRIVTYNTGNRNVGLDTIFWGIGSESKNGIARPADVIAMQEQTAGLPQQIANTLNSMLSLRFGITNNPYTVAGVTSGSGDDLTVLYRNDTVQFVGFSTVTNSTGPRNFARAQLRPLGYTSASDFYLHSMHLKASDTTTDAATRAGEVLDVRAAVDALGGTPNVIYAGDMNLYRPSEAGYRNYVDTIASRNDRSRALDPTRASFATQNWTSGTSWATSANVQYLSQSPVSSATYSGQVTGGIDDRFDYQLVTAPLMDGRGLAVIPANYRVFGNDGGAYLFNSSITNPSNTFAGQFASATLRSSLLPALANATDHLPVVADYQIPARLGVGTLSLPGTVVLRDAAGFNATVAVSNTAVGVAAGIDALSVTATGSASASSSQNAVIAALGSGVISLPASTAATGLRTATITVTPTSQGVPEGPAAVSANYLVVDASNASLAPGTDVDRKGIDFGVVRVGTAQSQAVPVYALQAGSGFTADLGFVASRRRQEWPGGITLAGSLPGALAGGSSAAMTATVDTSIARTYEVSYQLTFRDTNVFGGTASQAALTIDLAAKVVAFADLSPITAPSDAGAGAISAPFSFDAPPTLSLADLTSGGISIAPQSRTSGWAELLVTLTGDTAARSAALADWSLDAGVYGYRVTPTPTGAVLRYDGVPDAADLRFAWNLTGTGAALSSITVVPETATTGLLLLGASLLMRRRRTLS